MRAGIIGIAHRFVSIGLSKGRNPRSMSESRSIHDDGDGETEDGEFVDEYDVKYDGDGDSDSDSDSSNLSTRQRLISTNLAFSAFR